MPKQRRFDDLLAELTDIAQQLEGEQTDLEDSLKLYRRGQTLVAEARKRLAAIEHEFTQVAESAGRP